MSVTIISDSYAFYRSEFYFGAFFNPGFCFVQGPFFIRKKIKMSKSIGKLIGGAQQLKKKRKATKDLYLILN